MEVDIKLLVKTYPKSIIEDIYNLIIDDSVFPRTNLIYDIINYRRNLKDSPDVDFIQNEIAIINAITAKRTVRSALRRKLYNYISPVTTINN